jgi:hypothetical protein
MPNPYTARVDVRRFLNLPGFHGGAYVVVYVEDTTARAATAHTDGEGRHWDVNPTPRIILEIADCSDRINLEFEVHSDHHVENSLHKVDVLLEALTEFRSGLVEEARLYRERSRRRGTRKGRARRQPEGEKAATP